MMTMRKATHNIHVVRTLLLLSICFAFVTVVESFVHAGITTSYYAPPFLGTSSSFTTSRLLAAVDDDDNNYDGPEQSQMINYISDYLNKNKVEDSDRDKEDEEESSSSVTASTTCTSATAATHLIAIPVDACHELMIELESVQRAILYHCPILVHACITQAMTRLPLLYVHAHGDDDTPTATATAAGSSSQQATTRLKEIVEKVVDEFIFSTEDTDDNNVNNVGSIMDQVKREDGRPDLAGANEQGVQPLMIPFQSLEIDGANNQVLFTVADASNPGTKKLQRMVQEMRERIQDEMGWKTSLPPDPNNNNENHNHNNNADQDDDDDDALFRPRIPFMRLPSNWNDLLETENRPSGNNNNNEFLTSDQGGNGISPIFWGQWMGDAFGEEARMREVAVYKRRPGVEGIGEDAFYVPNRSVRLPAGNAALAKVEAKFEKYQDQRMSEEAEALEGIEQEMEMGDQIGVRGGDPLFVKTRDRLEALYQQDQFQEAIQDDKDETGNEAFLVDKREEEDFPLEQTMPDATVRGGDDDDDDPNALDDWTRERIRHVVESRARVQSEKELLKTKKKPPVADNPVFNQYKEGTLVPDEDKPAPVRDLPPFPSREHVVGFWRVLGSPTGFEVEEGDDSRSDNIIMRVDGTVAGGPILDQETRQKASGGTWRLTGDTTDSAQLRIRLVIPPKKERILVMEGKLELVAMSSDIQMAKATFGIPALEERAARAAADMEDILHCSGMVSIEDAVTGRNRKEIGKFSLTKLNTPTDPSQFTITIPRPVRNQD